MRIELNIRRNRGLLCAAALAVAAPYLFWVQNHYRAALASEVLSLDQLQLASRLEPQNAEYRDLLGRFYLFAMQDTSKSIAEFEQATRLNPHSSRYWLDLATAQGLAANTDAQRRALQHALDVDPKTPSVAWEAGNFFLVDGNIEAALKSFRTVIEYDPIAVRPALELSWRATHDAKAILDYAMPATLGPHLEMLRMLYEQKQTEPAMSAWRALARLNEPFKVQDIMPFVDHLLREREITDAQEVWTAMARISQSLRPSTSDGNLIVNGSFDEEIIPGGFSWRLEGPAAKSLQLDDRELQSGTTSVSLSFEGPAFSDYGLSQLVPVKPDQMYQLLFTAKSQEIITAEGPRIMVEDAFSRAKLTQGPEWVGTHGWNEEQILFSTKADTRLIRIYVGRVTGAGLIRGKLWLDNVRMYER